MAVIFQVLDRRGIGAVWGSVVDPALPLRDLLKREIIFGSDYDRDSKLTLNRGRKGSNF